jgi:hypothetical protein
MARITHDTATRERSARNARGEAQGLACAGGEMDDPPTTHRYIVAYVTSEDVNSCGDWAVVAEWSDGFDTLDDAFAFVQTFRGSWLPRPIAIFDLDDDVVFYIDETHDYVPALTPCKTDDYA